MDPTGDIPWEEEPTAGDVVHVETPEVCPVICDINIVSEVNLKCYQRVLALIK